MSASIPAATTRYLTSAEVAEQLGVRPQTLAQWRWRRTGPEFVRIGRLVRYTPQAVETWLATGGVTS